MNYNVKDTPSIENVEVKCVLPEGASASSVRLYAADSDNYSTLNSRMQDRKAVFTVPKLKAYCMAVVSR